MSGRLFVLLFLFFGSGVSALAYEVVWIRLLSLTLSVTVYSLTTVLVAFMAGLALGAAISSTIADRVRNPLIGFGFIELGIATTGLTVPGVLFGLGPAYVWLHDFAGGGGVVFGTGRFLLCFAVLLVPTTLMGLTLPLLSRAVIDREGFIGQGAGALYATNTIGAVVGCVGAGFLLIPNLGLSFTSATAASLNVAIGIAALVFGFHLRGEAQPESEPERESGPPAASVGLPLAAKIAIAIFALSGFTSLGYEVLWTRALEHYTHNSTYAYTAMLGTFLAGLGFGSALMARFADRLRNPLFGVGLLQVGVALSVTVSLSIFSRYETLIPKFASAIGGLESWGRVIVLIFSEASIAMLTTTLLLGAMFPLVAKVVVDSVGRVGQRIGTVYVGNTIGSILGSLAVGFWLLPWLGLRGAFLLLIMLNLGAAAVVALASGARVARAAVVAVAAAAVVLAFVLVPPHLFERQYASRFGVLKFYREGVTDTVMVTEAEDGSRMIRYGDGRGTAGTATVKGDRMYAHIPMLLHPEPRRVLQICFGVGNSLSSVLQYPVDHVDAVELSPNVIEAAPFFSSTNRDSIEDPRVDLTINDGRNFLLTSHDRYDVIRLDPPELHTAGIVNLYTKEFYQLARDHLAEGGIFSIWFNGVMTPTEDIRIVVRTALAVFPHVSVWRGPYGFSWIVNGSLEPHDPDLLVLQKHFEDERVRQDLATIDIDDPFRFLTYFAMTDAELERWAGEGPIVEDDHTILDFTVPKAKDSSFGIGNYNTDNWLANYFEPELDFEKDAVFATFVRKVRELARYTSPVLPHLRSVEEAGFSREEAERRIREAQSNS